MMHALENLVVVVNFKRLTEIEKVFGLVGRHLAFDDCARTSIEYDERQRQPLDVGR